MVQVKDGGLIHRNLAGLTFEQSAFEEMQQLVAHAVDAERNLWLVNTTAYTSSQAVGALGEYLFEYQTCVRDTSCFTSTPIITRHFVQVLRDKLDPDKNGYFSYWDVDNLVAGGLCASGGLVNDEISQCYFLQDDAWGDDRNVCQPVNYPGYEQDWDFHCKGKHCHVNMPIFSRSRCEKIAQAEDSPR